MQSRTLALTFLTCALSACAGAGGAGDDMAEAKLAARNELESSGRSNTAAADVATSSPQFVPPSSGATTPAAPDVCRTRGWYGDGECDAWCPAGDAKDCAPSTGGVACAEFFSPADGICNRTDPCAPLQDEDCMKTDPGAGSDGCAPDRPVDPALPKGDGKCEPKSAAELKTDPDCASLICPALFSPADGVCNAKSACDYVIDEDCARGGGRDPGGVACDAIAYPTNGKCEAPAGCEANDPQDCKAGGVACIAIAYAKNGKCEAAPGCEGSDPDC